MKKTLFTLLTFITAFTGISQELSFEEVGFDSSYCRQFGYQSGNGIVYASATGGTPDYNYLWEHLETGITNDNSTWGGRNPGTYKITVTDDAGTSISETLTLDSLNVIANFHIFSDDLSEIPGGYVGFAPDTLGFINLSENFANPNNPSPDPRFFWSFDPADPEWLMTDDVSNVYKGYLYGGEFNICLVAQNKNGCADTTCKIVGLFGTMLGVDKSERANIFTITARPNNNELIITKEGTQSDLRMNLYSLSGQLIRTEDISDVSTSILFNFKRGIYLYDFADKNGQIISSGKFNF